MPRLKNAVIVWPVRVKRIGSISEIGRSKVKITGAPCKISVTESVLSEAPGVRNSNAIPF